MSIPHHPFAELFPLIEGEAFEELVADIRQNGLHEEIVLLDGMILDGRNRYRAALAAGLDLAGEEREMLAGTVQQTRHFLRYPERNGDALHYVLSLNLHRRHLTDGQRVMIAAEIATMKQGRPALWRTPSPGADAPPSPRGGEEYPANWPDSEKPESVPRGSGAEGGITQAEAAKMLGVSERQVRRGRQVFEAGAPEVIDAAKRGDIAPSAAAEISKLPVGEQLRILREGVDPRALRQLVKEKRAEQQLQKRERRDGRAAELATKHRALPTVKAGIIVADPAWRDEEVWSDETGMDRAADNHYPTMSLEEIMDLDIGSLAAADCILLLWCKTSNLLEAIAVATAAGFVVWTTDAKGRMIPDRSGARYASGIAWDKVIIGNGRWVRDRHEHLLIFRRGNPVAPAAGTQLHSVIAARKTDHSAKPEAILDWIDQCWPDEIKIELNRRGAPRPGWLAWGNEAEEGTSNTQRESGTAREAPGGSAPSDGIAGLREDRRLSSEGGPVAQSAPPAVDQEGAQPAPAPHSDALEDESSAPPSEPAQPVGGPGDEIPAPPQDADEDGYAGSSSAPHAPETADAGATSLPTPKGLAHHQRDGWAVSEHGHTVPVANTGEGANGALAAASGDPASREDDADQPRHLSSSGLTGAGEVASADLPTNSPGNANAIIREGYARNAPLEELAALTGLTENAVKQRAKRMKLGDPARQRAAVAEANRRRAGERTEP